MLIQEKYKTNDTNEKTIQLVIDGMLEGISKDDITATICSVENELKSIGRNKKYSKPIEDRHTFYCKMEFNNYLMLQEAQSEFVQYVKKIYLHEIACFYLMNEKKLMPVSLRQSSKIELNFEYIHGNKLFDLYVDALPFDIFIIL